MGTRQGQAIRLKTLLSQVARARLRARSAAAAPGVQARARSLKPRRNLLLLLTVLDLLANALVHPFRHARAR